MKTILLSLLILAGTSLCMADNDDKEYNASNAITGIVIDQSTGEPLVGAKIIIEQTGQTAFTDFEGRFVISSLSEGTFKVTVSLLSYKNETTTCKINQHKQDAIVLAMQEVQ